MASYAPIFNSIVGAIFGVIGFVVVKSIIAATTVYDFCPVVIATSGASQTIANAAPCFGGFTNGTSEISSLGVVSAAIVTKLGIVAGAGNSVWAKAIPNAWGPAETAILGTAVPIALGLITFVITFSAISALRSRS